MFHLPSENRTMGSIIAMSDVTAANASRTKNTTPKTRPPGQRAKYQAWTRARIEIVTEYQREDHEAGKQRHKRVGAGDDQCRFRQRDALRHISAISHEQTHRDADREECLTDGNEHGTGVDLAEIATEQP
jgi:hypothetical protein